MASGQGQPSQRRTIEQERAQQAWKAIDEMRTTGKENDYGSRAKNLPSMIQTNGLGAAMAFLLAKAGKPGTKDYKLHEHMLYQHISRRVVMESPYDDLMDLIRQADTDAYRRATAEAIAFSIWLKRYVEAEGWKASN